MADPDAGVGVTAFSPVPAATPAWNSRGKVQADNFQGYFPLDINVTLGFILVPCSL